MKIEKRRERRERETAKKCKGCTKKVGWKAKEIA